MRFPNIYCFLPRIGLLLILISCPLYFSGQTHAVQLYPFEKVSAYHSQNDWPASAMLFYTSPTANYDRYTTVGSGWGNDSNTETSHLIAASLVGSGGVTLLNNVNNIAVFSLDTEILIDANSPYLWINIDCLYGDGHQIRDFRLYITDAVSGTDYAIGGGNSNNQKNSDAGTIIGNFGLADIWTPLTSYPQYGVNSRNEAAMEFITDGGEKTGEIKLSHWRMFDGHDRNPIPPSGYYLLAEIPDGITGITGLKLEFLMDDERPGMAGNRNSVLTNFRVGTVSDAMFSDKTVPIGYTIWGSDAERSQYTLSDLKNITDPNLKMTLRRDKWENSGVGYDFNGFRTVNEISFRAEGGFDSVDVFTSAGKMSFSGSDLVSVGAGQYTLNLDGVSTSYLFIQPKNMSDGMKIGNLDVNTVGAFAPWENLAAGKRVWCEGLVDGVNQIWLREYGFSVLTDGKMDLSFVNNMPRDNFVDPQCVFLKVVNKDGVADPSLFPSLVMDLEAPTLVNTLGLFQNLLFERNSMTKFQLDFWNDGDTVEDWQTFVFSTNPNDGEYRFYEAMYQQITFDDVFAQYMRLTPQGYSGNPDWWWGVAELQLFHKLPEPATWGMMLFGTAAGAFCVWRRRKQTK